MALLRDDGRWGDRRITVSTPAAPTVRVLLLLTEISNAKLIHETKIQSQMRMCAPSYLNFHGQHPQADTHEVCLMDEELSYVPNFIGGAIPCKDSGSREEYCMTMLTLFKPWRFGKDLRDGEDTNEAMSLTDTPSLTDKKKL